MINFFNRRLEKIYKYIYIHNGETILIKDIAQATAITEKTVRKWIKWLIARELIKKDGKKFSILPR